MTTPVTDHKAAPSFWGFAVGAFFSLVFGCLCVALLVDMIATGRPPEAWLSVGAGAATAVSNLVAVLSLYRVEAKAGA